MKVSLTTSLFTSLYGVDNRCSRMMTGIATLSLLAFLAAMNQRPLLAQTNEKKIYLSDESTIYAKDIGKPLQKECPNTSFTTEKEKSDYILDAKVITTTTTSYESHTQESQTTDEVVLFDKDHRLVRASSGSYLGNALKDICHAIKNSILIEIVDSQTMTESLDVRGVSGGTGLVGAVGTIVNDTAGRRTHTDNSLLYVVANGEHAILDCYERRKGCVPTGNGKYYAEFDGESLWVDFRMPLIHAYVRNHYVVAGGW